MPTISMFFGIIIRMDYGPKEHNPPHIHVYYQDYSVTMDLEHGNILTGELPSKQRKMVEGVD